MDGNKVNRDINKILKTTGKVLLYAIAAFVLVYIAYTALKANFSSVKTEVALMKTVEKSISTKVFIVRDEQYLSSNISGTVVPLVEDGQRVGEGQDIAAVFTNDTDAGKYVELQKINEECARFENIEASDKLNIRDMSTYDQTTNEEFLNLVESISKGDYEEIENYAFAVRDRETSRQISLGYNINTAGFISSLKAEAAKISVPKPTYLKADNTGYYISSSDGYENIIKYSDVTKLTVSQVNKALEAKPDESKISNSGKLVNNFNWYVVATVDRTDIDSAKTGDSVKIRFLDSSAGDVSATIAAINADSAGKVALVLKCNIISADTSQLRIENAEIILDTIIGYRIPKEALRTVDGVNGVYIKRGNLVNFRRITTLYTGDDYVIARTYEEETSNYAEDMDIIEEENRIYTAQISQRYREEPGWIIKKEDLYSRSKMLQVSSSPAFVKSKS